MNTRRNFLKASLLGAGACAFGPLGNVFGAGAGVANTNGAGFAKRFIFIRVGNGLWPSELVPPTLSNELKKKEEEGEAFEEDLDRHELPNYLKCLTPYKEHMTILQGMSSRMAMNGHHSYQSVMTLCRTPNADVNTLKRASIDYELAKLFPSPLGHVELSFANQQKGIVDGWSVPQPFKKNFCYADAITAYNNLFQCVIDPESVKRDIEMFDHIHKEENRLNSTVRGADGRAQENHVRTLEAIGKRNEELLAMRSRIAALMPDRELVNTLGRHDAFSVDQQKAMTEVLASAVISGLTNVATYTMDNLDFRHSGLPGLEQAMIHQHSFGHGQGTLGVPAEKVREIVRIHHFEQVKTLVERLKAQREGRGTMFDNTMIMFFPEGGEKHHGTGRESPWVVMSGKNCNLDVAGRYIRVPRVETEGHKTLGNWYTTLLNAHGNPIAHYGDLDGGMSRKRLDQKGAIKRFMSS